MRSWWGVSLDWEHHVNSMAKRFAWGTGDGRKLYKGLGVAYRLKVGSFKNHHMVGDKPQRNEG